MSTPLTYSPAVSVWILISLLFPNVLPARSGYDIWSIRLTISNSGQTDTASFGISIFATKCIDASLGEMEMPPFPPHGALFSTFTENSCLGNGLKWDIHPLVRRSTIDTFRLKLQLANDSLTEAIISWDKEKVGSYARSAEISGGVVSADMLQDSELDWDPTNNTVSSVRIIIDWVTYIEGARTQKQLPASYSLSQNYPNPFNPSTVITYQLLEQATVHLSVYNVLGQEVRVLANSVQEAGEKSVTFDAAGLTSGVYFYRLEASSISEPAKRINESKRLLLVK